MDFFLDKWKDEYNNNASKPELAEPVETFYHASDSKIDTFDLSKTKPDQNGIGLAVNTKKENAYKDKPNQYEFD